MASADTVETARVPGVDPSLALGGEDAAEDPNDSPLGYYAGFPYSPEPFAKLSSAARNALIQLDRIATQADSYARRMEVEQALTYRGFINPL